MSIFDPSVIENIQLQKNKQHKLEFYKFKQAKEQRLIELQKECHQLKKRNQQLFNEINLLKTQKLKQESNKINNLPQNSNQSEIQNEKIEKNKQFLPEIQEDKKKKKLCKHYGYDDIKQVVEKQFICLKEQCKYTCVICKYCREKFHKQHKVYDIEIIREMLGHQIDSLNKQIVQNRYNFIRTIFTQKLEKIAQKCVNKFNDEIIPYFEAVEQAYSNLSKAQFNKMINNFGTQARQFLINPQPQQVLNWQKIRKQVNILVNNFTKEQLSIKCTYKWDQISKFHHEQFKRVIERRYNDVNNILIKMFEEFQPIRLFNGILAQSNVRIEPINLGLINNPDHQKNKIISRLRTLDYLRLTGRVNYQPNSNKKRNSEIFAVQQYYLNQEFQNQYNRFPLTKSHSVLMPCPGYVKCIIANRRQRFQYIYYSRSEEICKSGLDYTKYDQILKQVQKNKQILIKQAQGKQIQEKQGWANQRQSAFQSSQKKIFQTEQTTQRYRERSKKIAKKRIDSSEQLRIQEFEAPQSLYEIMIQKRQLISLRLQRQIISQQNNVFFQVLGQNKLLRKLHFQLCGGLSSSKLCDTILNNGIQLDYLALIYPATQSQIGGESLWKLTTLQTLILLGCFKIIKKKAKEGLQNLKKLTRLQISHINGTFDCLNNNYIWFGDDIMQQILKLKQLKHLNIQQNKRVNNLSQQYRGISGKNIPKLLEQLQKLRTLIFQGSQIENDVIEQLSQTVIELQTDQNRRIRKRKQIQIQNDLQSKKNTVPKTKEEKAEQEQIERQKQHNNLARITINQLKAKNIKTTQRFILIKSKKIGQSKSTKSKYVALLSSQLLTDNNQM